MAVGDTGADLTDGAGSRSGARSAASLIYDPKARGLFFQTLLLVSVVGFFVWIVNNTIENLARLDKKTGFGFLGETAGFQILTTPGTWLLDFGRDSTYFDIFLIGVFNTVVVSFLGIFAATIIGFVIGIFRLSSNAVLRGFGSVYVEVIRNVPLLAQLLVWYTVVISLLPARRGEPLDLLGWIGFPGAAQIDISGLYMPYPLPQSGFWLTTTALLLAVAFWIGLSRWAKQRQDLTGQTFPVFWTGLGVFIGLPVLVFLITGSPLEWEEPLRGRFGFRDGVGMVMKPEMVAVFLALSLYTAGFIAEIVRAGILAVNKGQSEAANALGLRAQPTLNLVVIPQAMRVIIPPLTSQFLNLMKNSSLAVAIAYPDVVSIFAGTALNQVGQEIEMIFMMMMVYLLFSLLISVFMNWYNHRIALVER